MAKLKCTEVSKRTALEAMQLMGGSGCAREFGMEGQVRARRSLRRSAVAPMRSSARSSARASGSDSLRPNAEGAATSTALQIRGWQRPRSRSPFRCPVPEIRSPNT
ncbi:acyl-CoA dehydrogenase family protein [Saccharopolyspora sp. NPDC002578]